jgi:hypothetical protein
MILPLPGDAADKQTIDVSDLSIKGKIEGENIVFALEFTGDVKESRTEIPLVIGDVAPFGLSKLPSGAELSKRDNMFLIKFNSRGKQRVLFNFASRPIKNQDWRQTSFTIPMSTIRRLMVECDRDDLEIKFPGALKVERGRNAEGRTEVTAFLGVSTEFQVDWKPEVRKLAAEAVIECRANTIATASIGALRLDTVFTYKVAQGSLDKLLFAIPKSLNVTQVRGDDIRDWSLDKSEQGDNTLSVALSRPKEDSYRIQIEGETVLAKFPCPVDLPVIIPKSVIRTSGFLAVGTDSAIKLIVRTSLGLTQIDQASFVAELLAPNSAVRPVPQRSSFAYQFANIPYDLVLNADDIVPEYSVDHRIAVGLADDDLSATASIELDVRDAGARETVIQVDPSWSVANVAGRHVADYDVQDKDGERFVHVYFKDALLGRLLLEVRLEKTLGPNELTFSLPSVAVQGAKSERGHVALAAEKGLRLRVLTDSLTGMREVHTGSVPFPVPGIQQALRFKESGWQATVQIQRTRPGIHAEVFHLVSVGEGVLYCSTTINYLINGAPTKSFTVTIPEEYQNVEFAGRDIRNWSNDSNTWTVVLQEKAFGDYTLGITYDRQFDYRGGEISVGGVNIEETESEVGYIALASSADLIIEDLKHDGAVMKIDPEEIPTGYKLSLLRDPILRAYKYVVAQNRSGSHIASVKMTRLDPESMLTQVADHTALRTTISDDGELETTAVYRIKNASEQYLVVKLAKGCGLCTVLVDENGERKTVVPREKTGEDGTLELLIPISRQNDVAMPMEVEVIYTESKRLGTFGGTISMQAPQAPQTHTTFGEWHIVAPQRFAIAHASGNMIPINKLRNERISGPDVTLAAAWFIVRHPLLLVTGEGRAHLLRTLKQTVGYGRKGRDNTAAFTDTMLLKGADPLQIKLRIVPLWAGMDSSILLLLAVGALGIGLVTTAARSETHRLWRNAAGLTLVFFALTQIAAGRLFLATIIGVIGIFIVLWLIVLIGAFCKPRITAWLKDRKIHRKPRPAPKADAFPFAPIEMPVEKNPNIDNSEPPPSPDSGFARIRLLALIAAIGMALSCATSGTQPSTQQVLQEPVLMMDRVNLSVTGPGAGKDEERSAVVAAQLEFKVERPLELILVQAPSVLTDYELGSKYARITATPNGYLLNLDRKGSYRISFKYLAQLKESAGEFSLQLSVPDNMQNEIVLALPETGMDIECAEAVHFKKTETQTGTEATAVLGSARTATLVWRPRVRKAKLEKVVYFCEVNTLASFEPGVVDLTHLVRFQIAQGELKRMELTVPDGMNITAVQAKGLGTWRFDPEKHLLEAVLDKAAAGDLIMLVSSQVACKPDESGVSGSYSATIGTLGIAGASRQRGSVAVAAPDTMQVRSETTAGLNAMNIVDFSSETMTAANFSERGTRRSVKRAFRYNQLPVSATVHAELVLPEIRVNQAAATFSIADERIMLAAQLEVTVAKAGVFSLYLNIPDEFDIETLTGEEMSHWDEIEGETERVVIHFKNQILGTRRINIVLARMEKGIEENIAVPRITVKDARKYTGVITVLGEAGVRLTTVEREGVSELNPAADLNVRQQGALAFKLLRPEWKIVLKTEIIEPSIKPEVLQRIDLAEGMLLGKAWIHYKIENAGTKTFLVQSPNPAVPLTFSDPEIAKTELVDPEQGIWKVDLHNKQLGFHLIEVSYQEPFPTSAKRVTVRPLRTVGTDPQKGYLVVMSSARVEVKPSESIDGLKPQDAQSIPAFFSAGDMSDAILCYRTVLDDYSLELTIQRHESAEVLQAQMESVQLTSAIADSQGNMLTRVEMTVQVGDNFRFLEVSLPRRQDTMWATFVNQKVVETTFQNDTYRIPIERAATSEDRTAQVEFFYAGKLPGGLGFVRSCAGPRFNLPLRNIKWRFYANPYLEYFWFSGTMRSDDEIVEAKQISIFDAERYAQSSEQQVALNESKSKQGLDVGNQYFKDGNPDLAKKALEEAVVFAQRPDDREDARIQYQNVARQTAKVGLIQQRNMMRQNLNMPQGQQAAQMTGYNDGNFTKAYAQSLEQSLDAKENKSLDQLIQKILDQQDSAVRVARAIKITMPEHGRVLEFSRTIQVNEKSDMTVRFCTMNLARASAIWRILWPAVVLLIVFRFLGGRLARLRA